MANFWNNQGWKIAWVFCTFVLPAIIAAFVYSQL